MLIWFFFSSPHFSHSRSPGDRCITLCFGSLGRGQGWDRYRRYSRLRSNLKEKGLTHVVTAIALVIFFFFFLFSTRYEGLDQAAQCDDYVQDHGLNMGCVLQNLSQAEYKDLRICVNGSAAATLLRPLYTTLRLHNLGNAGGEAEGSGDPPGHRAPKAHILHGVGPGRGRGGAQKKSVLLQVGGCNMSGWIPPPPGEGAVACATRTLVSSSAHRRATPLSAHLCGGGGGGSVGASKCCARQPDNLGHRWQRSAGGFGLSQHRHRGGFISSCWN